jgi:putative transposase
MRAPVVAVGDGALGFWAAFARGIPRDPRTARLGAQDRQRPRRVAEVGAPGAKAAPAEIWGAEDKRHAQLAGKRFADLYSAKFAKAAAKISDDLDVLLTFYDYPAEHWVHLRTSNPIESTCATVRYRTRVTKGAGNRAASAGRTGKAQWL